MGDFECNHKSIWRTSGKKAAPDLYWALSQQNRLLGNEDTYMPALTDAFFFRVWVYDQGDLKSTIHEAPRTLSSSLSSLSSLSSSTATSTKPLSTYTPHKSSLFLRSTSFFFPFLQPFASVYFSAWRHRELRFPRWIVPWQHFASSWASAWWGRWTLWRARTSRSRSPPEVEHDTATRRGGVGGEGYRWGLRLWKGVDTIGLFDCRGVFRCESSRGHMIDVTKVSTHGNTLLWGEEEG